MEYTNWPTHAEVGWASKCSTFTPDGKGLVSGGYSSPGISARRFRLDRGRSGTTEAVDEET